MYLYISGFLPDDDEDDSLKYKIKIQHQFEQQIMDLLGWESLAKEADGELQLTVDQVREIRSITNEDIPVDLDVFIGVRV
jgi:DNA-directed RNA polymerase sigma subunit (sigma70/sigma32)